MNNIALPKTTEALGRSDWLDLARLWLSSAVLTALFVTFTPFVLNFDGKEGAGDLANQLGYSALSILVILGHIFLSDRAVLVTLARPAWIMMAFWLVASSLWALDPSSSLRSAIFTLLAMVCVTGPPSFPRDAADFRKALAVAALAVIVLSFLGLVLYPTHAIHQAGGDESGHAGLWRGIYSHKNVAGAVFGSLFFCGLYLLRARNWRTGTAVTVLSAVFVLGTGSKTALALMPTVALTVIVLRVFGGRVLPAIVIFGALIAMAAMTIGTVLSPVLHDLLQLVLPGTTFTGRTDLWRFALNILPGHEWTGFGLNGFWQGPVVFSQERNFELSWDPRPSPNGHNGFLDVTMAMGWPGLALGILVLVILPLADFVRVRSGVENQRLADMFLMILTYLLMNSFMESFFFDRANPVWVMVCFPVAGLRILSRHKIADTPR